MALSPLAVHDLAEDILSCVCAALDQAAAEVDGYPGCPPCKRCVIAGLPDWDCDTCNGGCGGQLVVNLSRIYATTSFPRDDGTIIGQRQRSCEPPQTAAVEMVVTIMRCAPVIDDRGIPPQCEELEGAARVLDIDAAAIFNALSCCLPATGGKRGRKLVLGVQRVLGPQAGCVGIEQRVTVALPGCACPEEES